MVSAEDRMKILQMLKDGRISPEAASELLQAIEGENAASMPVSPLPPDPFEPTVSSPVDEIAGPTPRWLRVRVTDTNSGRPRVNIRLPLGLVNLGLKLGQRYSPEIEGIDLNELVRAAKSNGPGPFVDVYDEEDGEHVEVFLE